MITEEEAKSIPPGAWRSRRRSSSPRSLSHFIALSGDRTARSPFKMVRPSFLRTPEALFGVTADHVVEGPGGWRESCARRRFDSAPRTEHRGTIVGCQPVAEGLSISLFTSAQLREPPGWRMTLQVGLDKISAVALPRYQRSPDRLPLSFCYRCCRPTYARPIQTCRDEWSRSAVVDRTLACCPKRSSTDTLVVLHIGPAPGAKRGFPECCPVFGFQEGTGNALGALPATTLAQEHEMDNEPFLMILTLSLQP